MGLVMRSRSGGSLRFAQPLSSVVLPKLWVPLHRFGPQRLDTDTGPEQAETQYSDKIRESRVSTTKGLSRLRVERASLLCPGSRGLAFLPFLLRYVVVK